MIDEFVFPQEEFPRELEIQTLAFMRIVFHEGFESGEDRFRTRMWDVPPPMHFVRASGDLLVSHVQVLPIDIPVEGRALRIGGVGGVLTYPQFRGEGHASALMGKAAEHIRGTADLGMLFCDERNESFYERLEWKLFPPGRVLKDGTPVVDSVMTLGEASSVPDPLRLDWTW